MKILCRNVTSTTLYLLPVNFFYRFMLLTLPYIFCMHMNVICLILFVVICKLVNDFLNSFGLGRRGDTSCSSNFLLFITCLNGAIAFRNAIIASTIEAAIHKLAAVIDIHGVQDRSRGRFSADDRARGRPYKHSS